jgi:hypothetical protein
MVILFILNWLKCNINKTWDIYSNKTNIMENNRLNNTMDQFLNPKKVKNVSNDGMEREECDLVTGECYTIREKDGIVERINKRYITNDGRQLLQD